MAAPRRDHDSAPPCVTAPPGSYLCVRARAVRLTTAGDAAERRRTRGPWTVGMVFGGAGHTAAGPMRQGGRGRVICFFYFDVDLDPV